MSCENGEGEERRKSTRFYFVCGYVAVHDPIRTPDLRDVYYNEFEASGWLLGCIWIGKTKANSCGDLSISILVGKTLEYEIVEQDKMD